MAKNFVASSSTSFDLSRKNDSNAFSSGLNYDSNSFGLGLKHDSVNHTLHSFNSSLIGHNNHVNESSLLSSRLIASNPIAIGAHQNNLFSQRGQSTLSFGQLGLGQKVTEVRRTYVTPHGLQVHSIIDYFPGQQQPTLHPGEVTAVTEVVTTTKFVTPTSNANHFLNPKFDILHLKGLNTNNNNNFSIQSHPMISQNLLAMPISSQKMNHPSINLESPLNVFGHNSSPSRLTSNFMNHDDHNEAKRDRVVLDPKPVNVFAPGIGVSNSIDKLKLGQNQNPIHSPMHVNINSHNLNNNESNGGILGGQVSVHNNPLHTNSNERESETGDGRTHSLPHRKYGPYTCPKCKREFQISQTFAAHMLSHYKYESSEERKRRLAAKYKRKHLRIAYSRNGLTLLPSRRPFSFYARRRNSFEKLAIASNPVDNNIQQEEEGSSHVEDGTLYDVKIKVEPFL